MQKYNTQKEYQERRVGNPPTNLYKKRKEEKMII